MWRNKAIATLTIESLWLLQVRAWPDFNIEAPSVYIRGIVWFSEQSSFISLYSISKKIKEHNLYLCYGYYGKQQMAGACTRRRILPMVIMYNLTPLNTHAHAHARTHTHTYIYIYTVRSRVRFTTIHFYDPSRVGPSTPGLWRIIVATRVLSLYLVRFWPFSGVHVFLLFLLLF